VTPIAQACAPSGLATPTPASRLAAGVTATPRQMLETIRRLTADESPVAMRDETRRVVVDGLRGAATFGTASAFAAAGVDALAKTGSAGGGHPHGLLVAVSPPTRPTLGIVVVVAGGAGRDAAEIAAEKVKNVPTGQRRRRRDRAFASASRAERLCRADVGVRGLRRAGDRRRRPPCAVPTRRRRAAITIRTFAAANMGRHSRDGFDVCDLTHCQVVRPATETTRRSADRTRGRTLQHRGAPASVFYTASCGGRSELALWGLARRERSAVSAFARRFGMRRRAGLERRYHRRRPAANVARRRIHGRDAARSARHRAHWIRRAGAIQLSGLTPPTISGSGPAHRDRPHARWNLIRSAAFDVTRTATGYRFTGKGLTRCRLVRDRIRHGALSRAHPQTRSSRRIFPDL
jgi:hypothetical protein